MDNKIPKVSIGMPVYNMADTLPEAIDTILNQTFTDFELIISDNASDDGTEEICRSYAKQDARITYHRNTHNIVGENFRLTQLLSKGEYFMWAAADDSRKPEMVDSCVDALEKDPDAVLAYPYTELFDPETGSKKVYYDNFRLDQADPAERYRNLIRYLDLGNMIYGLYRRDVLFKIPPMSRITSRFIIFFDAIFLANVVLKGKIIQIPEILFTRRRGKSRKWLNNIASIEKASASNYEIKGVSLPANNSIQVHVNDLLASDLPVETILKLIRITYDVYKDRFGAQINYEILRAADLAKSGKFTELWNGTATRFTDDVFQNTFETIYAGYLFDCFEQVSRFIRGHRALHIGKAYCLLKMGRRKEADLEIKIAESFSKQAQPDKKIHDLKKK